MTGVWRQVVNAAGARLWSLATAVAILAISARVLGEHGRGEFAAAFAWALLASSILYLSLGQVAVHEAIGRARDRVWRGRLLGTLAAFALGASVLGWLVAAILWLATDGAVFRPLHPGVLAVGLLLLPVLIWEQYGSAMLAMDDRVDIYNRAQVVGRSLGLVAVTALLAVGAGVYGLLLGLLLGQVWVAMRGITHLARASDRPRASRAYARRLLGRGLRLHPGAVATVLITSADVVIVAHYLGASSAGSYQLAIQLLYALTVVPQAATLIVYGRVVSGGAQEAWEQQRRIAAAVLIGVAVLSAVAAIGASTIIDVVAGPGFEDSVGVFRIVVIGSLGFALSALMAPQWIGRGLFGLASGLTVGVAALNVTANLVLVPREGLHGAAAVVIGTSMLMLIANAVLAVHCERHRSAGRTGPRRRARLLAGGSRGSESS